VFKVRGVALLDAWLSWARGCRIPAFVRVARAVSAHRQTIVASLLHGLSNARVESVNTRLRLLTRVAFGFRSPQALIGLAMLALGGLCPNFPDTHNPTHGHNNRACNHPPARALVQSWVAPCSRQ
jgi:transposase